MRQPQTKVLALLANLILAIILMSFVEAQLGLPNSNDQSVLSRQHQAQQARQVTFFDRLRGEPTVSPLAIANTPSNLTKPLTSNNLNSTAPEEEEEDEDEEDGDDEEEDDDEASEDVNDDDEDELEEELDEEDGENGKESEHEPNVISAAIVKPKVSSANNRDRNALVATTAKTTSRELVDIFGNKIKLENDRTLLVSQNKARDLGLITIKALLLGPLIGLTLKAALIRGLLYAIGAYAMHLFAPSLLNGLGLGSGLVGFARQLQPNYAQMLLPRLSSLQNSIPAPIRRLAQQYRQLMQPVIDSLGVIPEGHCRLRAVCETAAYLIRNSRSMSTSLQRISATVYLNFGTEYSKAWLDGIVQSDCVAKYSQCPASPFAMLASRIAETFRPQGLPVAMQSAIMSQQQAQLQAQAQTVAQTGAETQAQSLDTQIPVQAAAS